MASLSTPSGAKFREASPDAPRVLPAEVSMLNGDDMSASSQSDAKMESSQNHPANEPASSEDELQSQHHQQVPASSPTQDPQTFVLEDEKRRSGRSRKQIVRLAVEMESSPPKPAPAKGATPQKPPSRTTSTKRKQPIRGNFSSEYLLQDSRSKLAKINLTELFTNEDSWTALTQAQQAHLISLLPARDRPISPTTLLETTPADEPLPNMPIQALLTNSAFQTDLRLFQEDLSAGRYDPIWLRDAAQASKLRAEGKFDSWKEDNREAFWGQKQKSDWSAIAGDSAIHSLDSLCRDNYVRVGDIWSLHRVSGHRESTVRVEKEATVTSIDAETNLPTFKFPPAQAKFSAPAVGEDIVMSDVQNPKQLSDAMMREDGRISARGGNAWREFRCLRGHQDMGCLWDLRELYHARISETKETKEKKSKTNNSDEAKKEVEDVS